MQKSSDPNNSFSEPPVTGGADATQKTTYTVGKGTDDRAQLPPSEVKDQGTAAEGVQPPERRGTASDDA